MASRRDHTGDEKKAAAAYYELKTKAVDDLVNANVTNAPQVSEKELRKYRRRGPFAIPDGVKFFFVKWWFAGVVCYFLILPFGAAGGPMFLAVGIAYGMAMHALVNGYLRMKAEKEGDNDAWALFPKTGIPWLIANGIYGVVLSFLTFATYALLGIGSAMGPILFGTFVALWDGVFLLFKRLFLAILRDAKKNAG